MDGWIEFRVFYFSKKWHFHPNLTLALNSFSMHHKVWKPSDPKTNVTGELLWTGRKSQRWVTRGISECQTKERKRLRIILKLRGSSRDSHPPHSLGIIYSDWLANEVSQCTEKLSSVKLVDGTKMIGNRCSKISVSGIIGLRLLKSGSGHMRHYFTHELTTTESRT